MFRLLTKRIGTAEGQPPWGIGGAIGALVASLAALLVGATITAVAVAESQNYLLVGWSVGALLTIAFVWFTRRDGRYWPALRLGSKDAYDPDSVFQNPFWFLLIGVGMAIILDLIARVVLKTIIPDPELINVYYWSRIYGQPVQAFSWFIAIVFMVILQPVADGLIFQGLLLPSLRARLGAWPGFVLSAVLYGVVHFLAYQPPDSLGTAAIIWMGLIGPAIAGLIYNSMRVYTGSTRAAILTHMAFGLFAVIKLLTLMGR